MTASATDARRKATKVLMDGGSSLNILYANTLELLGLDQSGL